MLPEAKAQLIVDYAVQTSFKGADAPEDAREHCESMLKLCNEPEGLVGIPAFDDDEKYEVLAASCHGLSSSS